MRMTFTKHSIIEIILNYTGTHFVIKYLILLTHSQFDKSGFFDETDSDLNFYNDFYNYNQVVYNYLSIDQLNKTISFH